MPAVLLHYVGLKPRQTSWFINHRGGQVDIYPDEWVRLDLPDHPEVQPALGAGVAVVEASAPPDVEVLDETTEANRRLLAGSLNRPLKRRRSAGCPDVYALSEADLLKAARRFLPWPGWGNDLPGHIVDARSDRRGARPSIGLPAVFDKNFAVIYRVAGLTARRRILDRKAAREHEMKSSWDSGVYETKAECQRLFERMRPLPNKRELVGGCLRAWGVWTRSQLPAPRTLLRYRAALGTDVAARRYIDTQILEVLKAPCQRLILGPASSVRIGAYVPNKAAAAASTDCGASFGPVVLDIKPPYDLVGI